MITKYLISRDRVVVEIPEKTIDHMKAHSNVQWKHVEQAVSRLELGNRTFLMETVELPYIIGKSNCVSSEDKDVQMLYRKGRAGKSPVILDGEGTPTNKITIGICKKEDTYYLFTAFYGEKATREPWDTNIETEEEREECERFWSTHALCCTPDEIDWERSK